MKHLILAAALVLGFGSASFAEVIDGANVVKEVSPNATFEFVKALDGLLDLSVENAVGEVVVVPGSGKDMKISGVLEGGDQNVKLSVQSKDKVVEIRVDYPSTTISGSGVNISGSNISVSGNSNVVVTNGRVIVDGKEVKGGSSKGSGQVKLKVEVPVDSIRHLRVTESSGNIVVSGQKAPANSDRSIRLINSSGNVSLSESNGKVLDLRSSSGNVTAENTSGELSVRSSSGDVRSIKNQGDVTAKTSSGNVEVQEASGRVVADTSSGDIILNNPAATKESSHTSSGSVRRK